MEELPYWQDNQAQCLEYKFGDWTGSKVILFSSTYHKVTGSKAGVYIRVCSELSPL